MQTRTQQYLDRANENRQAADQIIADADSTAAFVRWASVMAFYAAVQYVNAYLFEELGRAPRTHDERENSLHLFASVLRPIAPAYMTLKFRAHPARYAPLSNITRESVSDLLDTELHAVRVAVLNNLPS